MPRRVLSVLLPLLFVPATCARTPSHGGENEAAEPTEEIANDPPPRLPGATCDFPSRLDEDHVVARGCIVDVVDNVLVENGHVLTIEPGATLRFHEGTYLEVGHKGSRLVAEGTAEAPIVFTSGEKKHARGDWVGIVFDDAIGEGGSVIDHAIVEYAGEDSHGGEGAVTVYGAFPTGRVSIDHTTFRHDALAAISDHHPTATFGSFVGNTFEDDARALVVDASVYAAMPDDDRYESPVEIVGGTIAVDGAFHAVKAGLFVTGPIVVNGAADRIARLTIERGATLRFAKDTWLEVGTKGPAALDAVGVTFTSAATNPKEGDWVGLIFGDASVHSRVSDDVVAYAGEAEHGGDGAITFVGKKTWQALDVVVSFVTFHDDAQAMISDNGEGCDKGLDPQNGNVFASHGEPCR